MLRRSTYLMVARHRSHQTNREATLRKWLVSTAYRRLHPAKLITRHQASLHRTHLYPLEKTFMKLGIHSSNHEHSLKSPVAFEKLFADDLLRRSTREISSRCTFRSMIFIESSEKLPSGQSSLEYLRDLSYEGAQKRYGSSLPSDVFRQLEKNYKSSKNLNTVATFDDVRNHSVLPRARPIAKDGPAANSVVATVFKLPL